MEPHSSVRSRLIWYRNRAAPVANHATPKEPASMFRPLLILAALSAAAPLAAQEPNTNVPTGPDSATFVVTKGADTVVTERFFRRALEVDGELDRRAVGRKETYQALLTKEGDVPMVQFAVWL